MVRYCLARYLWHYPTKYCRLLERQIEIFSRVHAEVHAHDRSSLLLLTVYTISYCSESYWLIIYFPRGKLH